MPNILILALLLPLCWLSAGCGGCGGRPVLLDDAGVIEDLGSPWLPDLHAPDAALLPPDTFPLWSDAWSPPDLPPPPDAAPPDAPPLKGTSVLYAIGPSSYALTFKRIKLDGTGKQTVAGLPSSISITTLYPTGSLEYSAVSRHRPTRQDHINASYRGVHLPGGRGTLYYFQLNSGGGRGYLQVWPSGKVTLLGSAPGYSTSQETYAGYVAIQRDGSLFAAVRAFSSPSKVAVRLFRTDGKTFSGGSKSCDVTPKAPQLFFIEVTTITVAKSHVYFAARPVGGFNPPYALFRAPLDCSAKASKVKLSAVGYSSHTVPYIGLRMVTSEDGSKLALAAGYSKKSNSIVVVDDASGTAVKVSEETTVDPTPGTYTMRGTAGVRLALSPGGKRIAWVADAYYGTAKHKLFVRPTDMSAQPVQVLPSKAF